MRRLKLRAVIGTQVSDKECQGPLVLFYYLFFFFNYYLFWPVPDPRCCESHSLAGVSGGHSSAVVTRPLTAAVVVAELGL